MNADHFSSDIIDFIRLLCEYDVKYVIVGGEAVIYYGHVRLTGDIDFFYESSEENAGSLYKALEVFWDGSIPGIKSSDEFTVPGTIIQFGKPPCRIDLINLIDGVSFAEAWESRVQETILINQKSYSLYYIGLRMLIKNKSSAKRHRDFEDIEFLKSVKL
jgi:hypothetical protein